MKPVVYFHGWGVVMSTPDCEFVPRVGEFVDGLDGRTYVVTSVRHDLREPGSHRIHIQLRPE